MLMKTEGLIKKFNGFLAVDGVSLSVPENEIRAVIGPNGAGKTTLFNLLMGIYSPTEGTIIFDGNDITDEPEHRRPYLGMSRSYQVTNIYQDLTVFENIQTAVGVFEENYYDMLRPLRNRTKVTEKTEEILRELDFESYRETPANALSHGDKRLLEIGMAMAADPKLILLDEPTAGMGTSETNETLSFIESLSSEMAIILVEHDIEGVMRTADKITVLERGEVIAEGYPDKIRQNERVKEAYLGGEIDA